MIQSEKKITRENALDIIKRFAKLYRKELGKVPGEIIIVGGGSIMMNYKFRDATQDFDVVLRTVSGKYLIAMKIRAHREYRKLITIGKRKQGENEDFSFSPLTFSLDFR